MIDWKQQLSACRLCPRECGINRMEGKRGICGQTDTVKAARAGLHMWEEPCISGKNGSGTVFFSGCALHCVFCQNAQIANGTAGKEITVERLAEIFLELQEQGANNINLVTPGHFVPQIIRALERAKNQGLVLPVVYNTSSYEQVDVIRSLEGYVDVYLPDLKYKSNVLSQKYSHAADYFIHASAAIAEMVRQTGEPCFVPEGLIAESRKRKEVLWKKEQRMTSSEYEDWQEEGEERIGIMVHGTVVRHLLMPDCLSDAKEVVKYLLDTYSERIYISLLNQYTPPRSIKEFPELQRKVTEAEYEALVDYAIEAGIVNGFVQEGEAAEESFIPQFDGFGI